MKPFVGIIALLFNGLIGGIGCFLYPNMGFALLVFGISWLIIVWFTVIGFTR